jgi:hypothetical protein
VGNRRYDDERGGLAEEQPLPRPWLLSIFLIALAMLVLVIALPAYALLLPELQRGLMGAALPLKIGVAFAALFPLGLVMGTFFPLGIKHLAGWAVALVLWCWAVNGATSVFAAIFSLAVGLPFGITAELAVGWAAYVVAGGVLAALALADRLGPRRVRGASPVRG